MKYKILLLCFLITNTNQINCGFQSIEDELINYDNTNLQDLLMGIIMLTIIYNLDECLSKIIE